MSGWFEWLGGLLLSAGTLEVGELDQGEKKKRAVGRSHRPSLVADCRLQSWVKVYYEYVNTEPAVRSRDREAVRIRCGREFVIELTR